MPISGSSQALVVPGAAAAAGGPTTYFSDTFTRNVTNGWGTADSGQVWNVRSGSPNNTSLLSVNGSIGKYDGTGATTIITPGVDLSALTPPFHMTWRMLCPPAGGAMEFDFQYTVGGVLQSIPYGYFVLNEGIHATGSPNFLWLGGYWTGHRPVGASTTGTGFSGFNDGPDAYVNVDLTRWIRIRINVEAQRVRAATWYDGDPEPVDDQIVFDQFNAIINGWDLSITPLLNRFEVVPFHGATGDGPYYFDDFSIVSGVSTPPSTFTVDTFSRTTTAGTPGTVNTACATLGTVSSGVGGGQWLWGSQFSAGQTSQCNGSAAQFSGTATDQGYRLATTLWSRHVRVACQAMYTGTGSGFVEFNFGSEGAGPGYAPTGFSVPQASFDWVSSNLGNFNDHQGAFSTNGPLFCTGQISGNGVFSESSTMGPLPKGVWVNLEVEMCLPHQGPCPNMFPGASGYIRSRAWPVGGMKPGWQCRASLTVTSTTSLQSTPYLEMEIGIRSGTTNIQVRSLTVSPTSPPDTGFRGALIYSNTGNANSLSTNTSGPAIYNGQLGNYDSDGFIQPFDLSALIPSGGGYVLPPGSAGVYRIAGDASWNWLVGGPPTSGYIRFFIAVTRSGVQYNLAQETIGFTEANEEIASSSAAPFRNIATTALLQDGDCVAFFGQNMTPVNWLNMFGGPNIGPGAPTPLPFLALERLGSATAGALKCIDQFTRTVASPGLGTGPLGTWANVPSDTTAGPADVIEVANGMGHIYSSGPPSYQDWILNIPFAAWTSSTTYSVLMKGALQDDAGSTSGSIGWSFYLAPDTTYSTYVGLTVTCNGSAPVFGTMHGGPMGTSGNLWITVKDGTGLNNYLCTGSVLGNGFTGGLANMFWCRLQMSGASTVTAKLWADGQPEPFSATVTGTVQRFTPGIMSWEVGVYNNAGNNSDFWMDSIQITAGCPF